MILGTVYQPVYEDFIVIDSTSAGFVSGINVTEFSAFIYDNNRSLYSGAINFYEMGNGAYRCEFFPDSTGTWFITVVHPVYFPYGKSNTALIYTSDLNILSRIAGLMQENYSVDQTMFDSQGNMISSRIRIYNNAMNVGTNSGVIATYQMIATYDLTTNQMTSYNVERV
jgi:hypothetical protein